MTHDEFARLIREPLLRDRPSCMDVLKQHGWLLIPDVRVDFLSAGQQGVFHSASLDETTVADFVVYEVLGNRLHWQFVCVCSPTGRIMEGSDLSAEFRQALQQISLWQNLIAQNGFRRSLARTPPNITGTFFSYRIVIGQSHQQTAEERETVRQTRQNNLRIRSFDWLLEKPSHYSPSEIEMLNRLGSAQPTDKSPPQ
ncbi:MAG: hypothetical protein KDA89_10235 [Planctomycetaceae bacterium]|nr:hypothetical protein [Planctomycetaceae bacterium]